MKKKYKVDVDCAACAVKMEDTAKKVDGVVDASINFMAGKMTVEFADGADEMDTMKKVLKACKKVESDCNIEF